MAHRMPYTVRFGDCDPAGIVYYPRFFHLFHQAMEEFFGAALGIDYAEFTRPPGLGLPAVSVQCDFRHPLAYGERVEVVLAVERVGTTSVLFRFAIEAPGEASPRAVARVVTVCMDLARRVKVPLSAELRARLEKVCGAPAPASPGG